MVNLLNLRAMSGLFLIAFSHNPVNFARNLLLQAALSLSLSFTAFPIKEKAGSWMKRGDAKGEGCCERKRRKRW